MMRVVSYGGGVQSTALLVLAAESRIDFPAFLFCNVGDDSENPSTLRYVREVAMPYATRHGIQLDELHRTRRDGSPETLYGRLVKTGSRSIPIPMRMSNGAPGNRACTTDFKIRVVARWLKEKGATIHDPALVALGISTDEFHRARNGSAIAWQAVCYPLLDLRLSRADCRRIIADAGLPIPPKSSCYFCPFHSLAAWGDLKRDEPALFAQSAQLETLLNDRRAALGKDAIWLTSRLQPLDQAIGDQAAFDFDEDTCESGYCMT